jgi:MFS family permease
MTCEKKGQAAAVETLLDAPDSVVSDQHEKHLTDSRSTDLSVEDHNSDHAAESSSEPARKGNTITIEEAMEKMGFGPFQILITVFSGLLWLADAMELMLLSVLAPVVQCQWGLSHSEAAAITSVVFVGFLLGGLIWGVISDIIGRKSTLLIVNIWILVFGVLSAIKVAADDPSGKTFGYPWLLSCRFGVGFGAGGTAQAVTYYAEFLPLKSRGICLVLIEFWWAVGSMFGALLALGVMNSLGWHWYLGIATIPLFLVLFIFPVSGVVRSLEINE